MATKKVAEVAETVKDTPKKENEVQKMLVKYGVNAEDASKMAEDLGIDSMDDLKFIEVDDLVNAGMKVAKARALVNDVKSTTDKVEAATTTVSAADTRVINQFETLLPSVPNDSSWIEALKTGGVLKVDESSYIAAIRAAFADRAGLYNIPHELARCIEEYADETEEQVDPTFYKMRKMLTRRNYGDIFAAIDGLDGTYITEERRREFLKRVNENLWPAIAESYSTLDGWYQTWKASISDPSMFAAALTGMFNGGTGMMVTPPDTAVLHDAGETLVNSINKLFRGTGVQIAAALAYDASEISKTLDNPQLPAMVGVRNKEMMLKKIKANVSGNYVRLEQNLIKYVLGFVKHDAVTSDVESNYFVALWQLGTQINWSELGVGGNKVNVINGVTGRRVL